MTDLSVISCPRTQRWVAAKSGAGQQTVRSLTRIGLLPAAEKLTAVDVVLAQCALALGATRSTNRQSQAGPRTKMAQKRDKEAMKAARRLIKSGKFDHRTTMVVYPDRVEVAAPMEAVWEWLQVAESPQHAPLVLLPVGRWATQLITELSASTELAKEAIAA